MNTRAGFHMSASWMIFVLEKKKQKIENILKLAVFKTLNYFTLVGLKTCFRNKYAK